MNLKNELKGMAGTIGVLLLMPWLVCGCFFLFNIWWSYCVWIYHLFGVR